jgi:p-hydroxybenzoate 3-monooxygenase
MEHTTSNVPVVVIGAGVAGLTVGNILLRNGIRCVIVEKRSRDYVEQRQRAGTVDTFGVRMLTRWGLDEVLVDPHPGTEVASGFFLDGVRLPQPVDGGDNDEALFIPQKVLISNLADTFLRGGGDLRYEADNVTIRNEDGEQTRVEYRDLDGHTQVMTCDLIAGCDGDRGASRASIPDGELTRYSHEFDYSWLSVLAQTPTDPAGMAIHSRGLAGSIPRGVDATRIYLQIPRGEVAETWTDERIWDELEHRFGSKPATGEILSTQVVPLRSVVYAPMAYRNLYLLGDAAHIVPPMSAKGIHLALHDADVFSRAVIASADDADTTLLASYSDDALRHVWNYQAFASWITSMMHDAGDASYNGESRQQAARAEMLRQFTSPTASRLFEELTAGLN